MSDHALPPPDISGVRIPLLVSGIFNILAAIGWASTCVLAFIAIPFVVLAIFEFMQYGKLGDPAQRPRLTGSTRVIAICEICTIITGNLPSMICGIIVLANLPNIDRR